MMRHVGTVACVTDVDGTRKRNWVRYGFALREAMYNILRNELKKSKK